MAAIKGKNTKPELLVRSWLHRNGFRFRLHRKDLPGKPDIVLPKYRTVIFVNGCFWHSHGCKNSAVPMARRQFWIEKLDRNTKRDAQHRESLRELGWLSVVIWECTLDASRASSTKVLEDVVQRNLCAR